MDVNASGLNMDNWENSDSFSVIVSEDDVLGTMSVPDSDTHSDETLTFTGTHDISMTKGSDNLEEEHDAPSNQCFTLGKQPVAAPVSGLNIVQQNEHLVGDSDSVQEIDMMHQDDEHIAADSNHIPGINVIHKQNDTDSVSRMDEHEENAHLVADSEPVSGMDMHEESEQLVADSDHVAEMDIVQHEHLIADAAVSGIDMEHHENEQLIADSDLVTGIDIEHNQNEQLIADTDTVPGINIVLEHHQNEEQLIADADTVPGMDVVHKQNRELIADPDHMTGIDIETVHHESQQIVDAESETDIIEVHYESHQNDSELKSESGMEINQDGDQLVTDSDTLTVMSIVNERNDKIVTDINHVAEMDVISEGDVFHVDANIENYTHDNLTGEQVTLSEGESGTNIGDGIDILAEASLGLLSENIFNKESVNQIKDIVASTIANFAPSNNRSTEVLSVTSEHGYTSVDIPPHTSVAGNPLFEDTIEKYTSQTEVVTPTVEMDDSTNESSHTAHTDNVEHDGSTMEPHPISDKIVIPVTLAEVSHILSDTSSHVGDEDLSEVNEIKSVNNGRPTTAESVMSSNVLGETKDSGEEFNVLCGDNIEIVESVEICMESSSAEVSFESPNATLQPQVQEDSKTYYENIKDSIEDHESHDETVTFHAIESNLMADSETVGASEQPQVSIELPPTADTIQISTSNSANSVHTINADTVNEVINESVPLTNTNESSQSHSDVKLLSERPQQGPMKVSISTSGTSKKVIVLLPSRVVGRGIDKQKDGSARPLQKMRPGVKVPSRNLSSQIVSADEIAKELYAQGLKKTPVRDLPQGGDLFYSRHLTKRLANRIVPSVASTSTVENISQPIRVQSELQNVSVKPKPMIQNIISIKAQPAMQNVFTVKPQSEVQNISVKPQPEVQTMSVQASGSIPDSADLLAILEGDVDEWSIDRPPPQLIEAVSSPITARSSPPQLDPPIGSKSEVYVGKLDPVIERELALQQLNSLDSHTRNKKDNPTKTRRKSKIQVKEDFDEVIVEEDGIIIRQPVVLVEDVKKKLAMSKKLGKSLKRAAPSESSPKVQNESKSSKEKASVENNKTDGVPEKKRKVFHVGESEKVLQKKTMKSPELVNGKLNTKIEKTPVLAKDKDKKLSDDLVSKHKKIMKKASDVEKKTKPPDTSTDKNKHKKRKLSDGSMDELVGPMSRNMPPPPRTYSARIKRSPMFPDFIVDHLPSTSKNKAVSVVASANKSKAVSDSSANKKDQKQLTKSPRVTTPNKDVLSPKKNVPAKDEQTIPPKKGRELSPEKGVKKEKGGRKHLSEIERLLMDEGAINMLYSVNKDEESRRSGGGSAGTSSKKNVLKSARRSHKDLVMKTRLVKDAVLCLSKSPDSSQANLRTKRMSAPPLLKKPLGVDDRKEPQDSNDSNRSPPPLVPFGVPSPAQVFTYPSKLHLAAEASRIIRRHSSSSNFSSRSTSPNPSRRLSVEAASPQTHATENIAVDSSDTNFKQARKKGVPIFVKKEDTTQTYKAKKKKYSHHSSPANEPISKLQDSQESKDMQKPSPLVTKKPIPSSKTKLKAQLTKPLQKVIKGKVITPLVSKGKRTSSTDKSRSKEEDPNGNIPDLTSCLAEAATAFIADVENPTSPSSISQNRLVDLKKASPLISNATSYSNLIKTLETDSQKRQDGEDSGKERSSVRQSVGSFHYKELSLRRYDAMVQVILTPSSTKVKNALSLQVLRELRDVLNQLRKDETCRAVLVTSTGSSFCQGLDFQSLINDKPDRRKAAAQELAHAVTKFMTSLAHFNKLIIAGVHGDAVGLGVTMLPFFDMVFASDKATFYTPYARLGQIPEGAAVITLPLMLGNAVTSELLFGCRKLTASEALHYGLVTRILWPDRFQEELLPIIRSLANQSAQSMEATKALLRHSLRSKLDSALEAESHLLVQHWTSSECQNNFKRYLDDEDVGPQRQRVDP